MIDLETGVRGFVITGQERFLQPWNAARAAFPVQASTLVSSVDDPEQAGGHGGCPCGGVVHPRLLGSAREAARRDEPSARSVAATAEGKRRVDALRAEFDRFSETERALIVGRARTAPTVTPGERSSWARSVSQDPSF